MCGIFAVISRNRVNPNMGIESETIVNMMIMTSIRGAHSTGIFGVSAKKPEKIPFIIKRTGGPFEILHHNTYATELADFIKNEASVLVGHGRYATKGNISVRNAHPFREQNITMVHNGTIHSGVEVTKEVQVDSHAFCIRIQKDGIIPAAQAIDGAFAVILHDAAQQKLFIFRNYQRPLHYVKTFGHIFVMSEKEALQYVLHKAKFSQAINEIKEFEGNKLYEIDLNQHQLDFAHELSKMEKPLPPPPALPQPGVYSHGRWQGWRSGGRDTEHFNVRHTPRYDKGNPMEFTIKSKGVKGRDWNYMGVDDEGNEVSVSTPDNYIDVLGMTAKVIVADRGKYDHNHAKFGRWYFIGKGKTFEIFDEDNVVLVPTGESVKEGLPLESVEGSAFRKTRNNRFISTLEWNKALAEIKDCCGCGNPLPDDPIELDNLGTPLSNTWACAACGSAARFSLGRGPKDTVNLAEFTSWVNGEFAGTPHGTVH